MNCLLSQIVIVWSMAGVIISDFRAVSRADGINYVWFEKRAGLWGARRIDSHVSMQDCRAEQAKSKNANCMVASRKRIEGG